MMQTLLFSGIVALLILEGALISFLILKEKNLLLHLSLGLPIAAVLNVLVIFDWTLLGVDLSFGLLIGEHAIITAILAYLASKKRAITVSEYVQQGPLSRASSLLEWVCMALIGATVIYSFTHAVLLPTFQYDSATNWTMRSAISFNDRRIAFDADESRGMAKPQYPFLFHALQITANQGQSLGVVLQDEAGWNDRAANSILWLLSLGSFIGLFHVIRKTLGKTASLLAVTMILGIPLLSLHLGQGYADIVLLQELLLSLSCLMVWIRQKNGGFLLLSGLFVTAAVWTKSEGLMTGLIPWILSLSTITYLERERKKEAFIAGAVAVVLSAAWPIFALFKGLSLTPHSADTMLSFHSEGVQEAIFGLFDRGSFGVTWYVLLVAVPWMLFDIIRKRKDVVRNLVPIGWGILVLLSFLFVYLFTPNVRFLLNAESYYRQMMIPAAMLILSTCVWFGKEDQRNHSKIA